jgi:hypothetical protein
MYGRGRKSQRSLRSTAVIVARAAVIAPTAGSKTAHQEAAEDKRNCASEKPVEATGRLRHGGSGQSLWAVELIRRRESRPILTVGLNTILRRILRSSITQSTILPKVLYRNPTLGSPVAVGRIQHEGRHIPARNTFGTLPRVFRIAYRAGCSVPLIANGCPNS